MPVLDNSPSKNRIRWCDIQVVYKGEVFNIKDDYTDMRYVYWDLRKPNVLLSSNELPYDMIELAYMNNNGVHTAYPNIELSVIDVSSSKIKLEHIDKSVSSLREFTSMLGENVVSMENQIYSIREMLQNIENRLKAIEASGGK